MYYKKVSELHNLNSCKIIFIDIGQQILTKEQIIDLILTRLDGRYKISKNY